MSTITTLAKNVHTLSLSSAKDEAKIERPKWFSETGKPAEEYPYKRWLPTWDSETKYAPLEPFEHVDPGHKAIGLSNPRAFLRGAEVEDITPNFGSEVSSHVQLHKLSTSEREQLALYVAQRGVVAFRNQDFIDQEPGWLRDNWGSFFGRNHIHPVSGEPKGYPEFHLVFREGKKTYNYETETKLTSSAWHSDVTYELQPPGLTALFLFDSPPSGGDTGYADQRGAYQRLSPSFRAYLETLETVHSGVAQADYARKGGRGGVVKRDPIEHVHPVVRTHPVTKEKALFVNRQFTRSIIGLKEEESQAILNLLYEHIEKGADFQIRVRWKPRTVVLWDNRITAHSAIVDFAHTGQRRHGARITPQAERPYL